MLSFLSLSYICGTCGTSTNNETETCASLGLQLCVASASECSDPAVRPHGDIRLPEAKFLSSLLLLPNLPKRPSTVSSLDRTCRFPRSTSGNIILVLNRDSLFILSRQHHLPERINCVSRKADTGWSRNGLEITCMTLGRFSGYSFQVILKIMDSMSDFGVCRFGLKEISFLTNSPDWLCWPMVPERRV